MNEPPENGTREDHIRHFCHLGGHSIKWFKARYRMIRTTREEREEGLYEWKVVERTKPKVEDLF